MTLLVGALYPWDRLSESAIFRSLPEMLKSAPAVIIAADSRWTYPDGRTEDGAVKVFKVGSNGLAAYAGSAIAGEDAIIALSTQLTRAKTIDEWGSQVQHLIARAWDIHQPNDDGLEILFGFSQESGYAWLGHFSSVDGFSPHEVTDTITIGPEPARLHFSQALRAATAENTRSLPTAAKLLMIETAASLIIAALADACELKADEAVGGKVLCAATMLGRPQGIGVTRLMPTPKGIRVDELGLDAQQGRMLRGGFKYTPPPGESR